MQTAATPATPATLSCAPDYAFCEWLVAQRGSLAISTYQAGKLLLVGWNGRQVSFLPRDFDKPMGLDILGERMALATRNHVLLLASDSVLAHHFQHDQPGRYDALYLPRVSYHTADLAVHDVVLTPDDLWIVNTRFSCLAGLSDRHSFVPRWRPKFVSECVPEDRCHLNGLAMVDGQPGYVTALGETDTVGGWREQKVSGGVVIDVRSNEIVLRGLAMPHSPRWYRGYLWVLNSGAGELLRVDPATGTAETVCALPGYLRGLDFVDRYALVGLCKIREQRIFGGMPVEKKFDALRCGVAVIDTDTGARVGLLEFTSGCSEIYDLRFLKNSQRPNVLNLQKEQTHQAVNAPDLHYWLRPENQIQD